MRNTEINLHLNDNTLKTILIDFLTDASFNVNDILEKSAEKNASIIITDLNPLYDEEAFLIDTIREFNEKVRVLTITSEYIDERVKETLREKNILNIMKHTKIKTLNEKIMAFINENDAVLV